jgi:cellulose biosynthesis protein BcsQ
MHKTIGLFNHKGGVSKTTTTFNLGWMMAEKGHRVLMIDTDPQCNLTGLVLNYDQSEDLDSFYSSHPNQNIHAALLPAFEAQPKPIEAVKCIEVSKRPGLFLLPGHVNLSEYEVTLGIAQEISSAISTLRNLPGAFDYLFDKTAESLAAEIVLLDMNPSLGAINQNLLMISDYFVIPTAPDYFSMMAIDSLAGILPKWIEWARRAYSEEALRTAVYPFPLSTLKFLGTVIQKYRPRMGKATIGFQSWIDQINKQVQMKLFPTLQHYGATLDEKAYRDAGLIETQYCLAQIPDFNTMIATSQEHQIPVFALTDEMFGHVGRVLEQDQQKREEFRQIFSVLADRVLALTSHA